MPEDVKYKIEEDGMGFIIVHFLVSSCFHSYKFPLMGFSDMEVFRQFREAINEFYESRMKIPEVYKEAFRE